MLRHYRFWLWLAVVLLLLNALIHTLTFVFFQSAAQNETERQLLELMSSYRQDFGAGFKRSTKDLLTALSACFSLVCLLGGLTLGFLLRKQAELGVMKGVVGIHVLVFGICFAVMVVFTFLPPIVLTGLIFLSLLLAYFLIPRQPETSS